MRSACSEPGSLLALARGLAKAWAFPLLLCSVWVWLHLPPLCLQSPGSFRVPPGAFVTPDDCPPVSALRSRVFSKQGRTEGSLNCSQEVTHRLRLQAGRASLRGTFFPGPGELGPAGSGLETELSPGLHLYPIQLTRCLLICGPFQGKAGWSVLWGRGRYGDRHELQQLQ